MTDRDLLARVITASGLSASAFARDTLIRDPRTVRRWLAGDSPIPKAVKDHLATLERDNHAELSRLINLPPLPTPAGCPE